METLDWIAPFTEPEFKSKIPSLGEGFGRLETIIEGAKKRKTDPVADAKASENPIAGVKGWGAYGAFDPEERKKVLDKLGFVSQLVFPTAGLLPMRLTSDEETRYAASRAYNRSIAAFCKTDPRLIAVAYVPLDNVALALKGAQEALDQGCGAVMFSNGAPGGRSPGHPDLDPFWQLLVDRDVPFLLHIGQGTMIQPPEFHNNGRPRSPDLHGGGENLRFCDYPMLWFAPQIFLTAMVYDGVFQRFPLLRGGVIESAAGWVPEFLRALDIGYRSFSKTDPYLQALDLQPSEYIRRAVKFTPFPSEDVGRMIRDAGPDLFMFSSDYPHPEGTNDPLGRFERTLGGLDEAALDKFFRSNYEALIGPRALQASLTAVRPEAPAAVAAPAAS
jgi:predicted TIM-barrel fold metal-dependent hydrolase